MATSGRLSQPAKCACAATSPNPLIAPRNTVVRLARSQPDSLALLLHPGAREFFELFLAGIRLRGIDQEDQPMRARLAILIAHPLGIATDLWRIHRDLKLAEIASGLGAHLPQLGQLCRQHLGAQAERRPAVANRDRIAQRAIHARSDAARADMNRRMRFAGRLRIALHRRELDELPGETRLRLGPQLLHRANILAGDRPTPLEVDAHDLAFIAQPSGADAENEASARDRKSV